MTILVAFGMWMAVVAMMLKFFQYVHDCDKQIENLGSEREPGSGSVRRECAYLRGEHRDAEFSPLCKGLTPFLLQEPALETVMTSFDGSFNPHGRGNKSRQYSCKSLAVNKGNLPQSKTGLTSVSLAYEGHHENKR